MVPWAAGESLKHHADPALLSPNIATGIRPSLGKTSANFSGIPTGLATSSAAPSFDTLRIVQSMALPPNSIVPALNTRFRLVVRFSTMICL
jgi:hypothetical protein